MRELKMFVLTLGTAALTALAVLAPALARDVDLGKQSKEKIRDACNKAGGELLGVSESGSYGCEVHDKGTMVLCNKQNQCTGYTAARTRVEHQRVVDSIEFDAIAEPEDPEVPEAVEVGLRSE